MSGKLNFSGSYAFAASFPQAPNPCLSIEGVGIVGLPLSLGDANNIINHASRAPYGHNATTIVNTDVRDTWEIEPQQIRFLNPMWQEWLNNTALKHVCEGLGVEPLNVQLEFYKLLLYQEGSQ